MEYSKCNLCGSNNLGKVFNAVDYITGELHGVIRCKECGLVFVNPQPDIKEIGRFYPDIYYGMEPFLYEKIDNFSRLRKIKRMYSPPCKLLDIGCGKGLLLHSLKMKDFEVYGIELSENSARYAKEKLGINVKTKDIKDCEFQPDYFDVITMFHSLEHMKDPKQTLKAIHSILKNDGILIIEVPKFDSLYSRIFKDKWFHLDVPRHLYHFEEKTIKSMLKTTGFSIKKISNHSIIYDVFGNVQSLLNYLCSKMNILNDMSTNRLTFTSMWHKNKRLIFDALLGYFLFPFIFTIFMVISMMLVPFNIGGTLIIYARKENS